MSLVKPEKAQQIEDIKAKVQASNGFVLVSYKGITVAEDVALRAACREANVEYKVLKNRLVNKALEELGIEVSKEDNSGTVVFCHCFGHGHTEDLVFKGRNYR